MSKSVCILGAGLAGIATARIFLEDRDKFQLTIFEKSEEFGGVWSESKAYANLCTNNAKHTFGFSDEPILEHFDEYPTAKQMLEYITSYVEKHQIKKHIHFGTEVINATEVQEGADSRWEITVKRGDKRETHTFDFLIVASGLFNKYYIPHFPNDTSFQGKICHAGDMLDSNIIKNKRVLIVGSGKSSGDMMSACAEHAKETSLIFRRAHWLLPQKMSPAKISTRYLLYSKWFRYILPFYNLDFSDKVIQKLLSGFAKGFWSFIRIATIMDMMVPINSPLISDYPCIGDPSLGVAPKNYWENIKSGKVKAEKTEIVRFVPNSKMVELSNGKTKEFDVVIYATGYVQGFPYFDAATTKRFQIPSYCQSGRVYDSPFKLYRHVIPISGPRNVGFVGFANNISNAVVMQMQAHWLSEYFLNNIHVPSEAEKEKDVENFLQSHDKFYPGTGAVGYQVLPYTLHLYDMYLKDLRLPLTRCSNFVSEYIAPVYPTRFRQMQEEKVKLRRTGKVQTTTHEFYFSFFHFVCVIIVLYIFLKYIL